MTGGSPVHIMGTIGSCSLNTILGLMDKRILLNHFKYRNVFWICVQAVNIVLWSLIPNRSQHALSDPIKTVPQNPTSMNLVLFAGAACELLHWHLVWQLFFFSLNDTFYDSCLLFMKKGFFSYSSAKSWSPIERHILLFSTKHCFSTFCAVEVWYSWS